MKLMAALLALLYCPTAFAMGEIRSGQGIGFDNTRARACDAAQMEAHRQAATQIRFLQHTWQHKESGKIDDCECEGPSSRRTDYRCVAKWRLTW
jgi:hypothetical protein